jgi:zinc transport system substrate-binding protein
MKNIIRFISSITLLLVVSCARNEQEDRPVIVTSIYPLYVMTLNIVQGTNWQVINIAPEGHHYQLTPADLRAAERASFFVTNGFGEPFMSRIFELYPNTPVINASFGIVDFIYDEDGHEHDDDEDDHDDEDYSDLYINKHFWLSIPLARLQVLNIAEQLLRLDPNNAEIYLVNYLRYDQILASLEERLANAFVPFAGRQIITFHDAFPYFARDYGFEIVATISHDGNETVSPARIIQLTNLLNSNPDIVLFAEEFYPSTIADLLSRETGRSLFTLNSAISGGNDPINSYVNAMLANMETIVRAMQ